MENETTYQIRLSHTFVCDATDALCDRSEDGPEYASLWEKFESAEPTRRGRGWTYTLTLTEDECTALRGEAYYRWELNGTDAYGVTDRDANRGNAAKRVWEQCCAAVGHGK